MHADGVRPNAEDAGGRLIPRGFAPYPVARALDSRRLWMKVARDISPVPLAELEAFVTAQDALPAGTACETWLPAWLAIATDHCGADLFVDLRGGRRHGCVMKFYSDAGAQTDPEWGDVAAMLYDIADRLEEVEPYLDDRGRIRWR